MVALRYSSQIFTACDNYVKLNVSQTIKTNYANNDRAMINTLINVNVNIKGMNIRITIVTYSDVRKIEEHSFKKDKRCC